MLEKKRNYSGIIYLFYKKKYSDLIYTLPVSVFYHSAFIKSHEHIDS